MATIDSGERCAYCHRTDVPLRIVGSIDTGSGAGASIFQCRDCITAKGGDPDAHPAADPSGVCDDH
jgi:hypothetical protein